MDRRVHRGRMRVRSLYGSVTARVGVLLYRCRVSGGSVACERFKGTFEGIPGSERLCRAGICTTRRLKCEANQLRLTNFTFSLVSKTKKGT
jgi:hypothetical protein